MATSIVVGCGGDDSETTSGAGGAGGSPTTTTSTGGSPTSTTSTTTTTTSAGGTGGMTTTTTSTGGTGGNPGCTEITLDDFHMISSQGPFAYQATPDPALGGADPDFGQLEIYDPRVTGAIDLGAGDEANYATCLTCLLAFEDLDPDAGAAKIYFQSGGTVDFGATVGPFYTGTITDATLVEVTIDTATFESTPVPGGACLHVTSAPLAIAEPPAGWTCAPEFYGDGSFCDCLCGVVDTDCADAALPVFGCLDGQTCSADGSACEGTPTAWTCAADQYDGGAGNGCDCNCGAPDPDCELGTEAIEGCGAGESCSPNGTCFPAGWNCDPNYYGDADCDCGCGVVDVDCADALVATCDFCNDTGSCNTEACPGTINPTNNAVCSPP